MENTEKSVLIRERLFECIHNGDIETEDLIQIFEHLVNILNPVTFMTFANNYGISYNGVHVSREYKKRHEVIIDKKKFILDIE